MQTGIEVVQHLQGEHRQFQKREEELLLVHHQQGSIAVGGGGADELIDQLGPAGIWAQMLVVVQNDLLLGWEEGSGALLSFHS